MKTLVRAASDEDITMAVRQWLGLLAAEGWRGAYEFLHHSTFDWWKPERIEQVVANGGDFEPRPDGQRFTVARLAETERIDALWIERRDVEGSGFVRFHLPLNGRWTDVTADLDFFLVDTHVVFELSEVYGRAYERHAGTISVSNVSPYH